jgi:hypothetical protein
MPTRFANIQKDKRKGGQIPFLLSFLLAFVIIVTTFDSILIWISASSVIAFILKFIFSRNAVEGDRATRYTWFRYTLLTARHRDKEYQGIDLNSLTNLRKKSGNSR